MSRSFLLKFNHYWLFLRRFGIVTNLRDLCIRWIRKNWLSLSFTRFEIFSFRTQRIPSRITEIEKNLCSPPVIFESFECSLHLLTHPSLPCSLMYQVDDQALNLVCKRTLDQVANATNEPNTYETILWRKLRLDLSVSSPEWNSLNVWMVNL